MAFHRVVRRYGHRGFAEADPAEPSWEHRPADAWHLLRTLSDADVDELEQRRLDQRASADQALHRVGRARREVVVRILDRLENELVLVERGKSNGLLASHQLRRVLFELRRRFAVDGRVPSDLFPMLVTDELAPIARGGEPDLALLQRRFDEHAQAAKREVPDVFVGTFPGFVDESVDVDGSGSVLTGIAGAPGRARGRAVVMRRPDDGELREGDILVTKATDTAWTPLFLCAGAVVCDLGAVMSHATIVARDLAIPAVVDVRTGTTTIRTGDILDVDGTSGTVTILERG
jgi:pyruvate,water dikinase